MANPFQRYQSGGFEAVPGIAQAGANIGQMLGSGFSNFGGSIGAGIKQYYENKAKSTAAMQEIEVLGPQLLARRNAYLEASGIDPATLDRYMQDDPSEGTDDEMFKTISANPMVQLAKTLDPAIEALKKAPTKGLSAQLAALNSGKAAIGMVDEQIKLQDFISKYRFEQTLNDLPDSVSVEQDVVTPEALFNPDDPLFTNVDKVRSNLKAAGFSDDKVELGVRQYLDRSGAKIRADETIGTPEKRAALIDALGRYAMGEYDTQGKQTEFGKLRAEADASYEQSMAETLAAEKAATAPKAQAPKDIGMTRSQLAQRKAQLDEQIKTAAAGVKYYDENVLSGTKTEYYDMHKRHRDQRAADLEYLKGERSKLDSIEFAPLSEEDATARITARATEAKKKPLELKETLNNLGSSILKNVTDDVRQRIAEGEPLTIKEIGRQITALEIDLNPTVTNVKMGPSWGPFGRKLPSQFTPAREIFDAAAKKLGIKSDEPITDEQFLQLQKEMLKGVKTQSETATKAAEERKGVTPEKVAADIAAAAEAKLNPQAQTPAAKSKPFSVGELELGTEIVDRRLNAAEKEAAAREFYAKRFGSVPPGFTQMYRQMFPEANIRTTEVNGIPVMVDGKGNVTPLVSNKEVDVEKQAAAKALTFDNTEIADGVRLSGVFAGTVAGAMAFRKDYAHMANVRSAVDELIKINEMGYETLSPTARARADQLQSEIIAAMRIPIVGPGQVAIPEQQILERIIQKGTGFFSLESGERAALKGLKDRMERELTNWPKSMGLEVKIGGQTSDTIKRLRMQKLRSARNLKPIGEAR